MTNDADEQQRPVPVPTLLSEPFWRGCVQGRLLHQRCLDCDRVVFKPQDFCPRCLSGRLEWEEGTGRGVVYSFSVVWRPQTPAFEVPYVVAIVELDEGYRMMTNIVNCEADAVQCGMRVSAVFTAAGRGAVLPFFEPAAA